MTKNIMDGVEPVGWMHITGLNFTKQWDSDTPLFTAAQCQQAHERAVAWRPIETVANTLDEILVVSRTGKRSIEDGAFMHAMIAAAKEDGEPCFYAGAVEQPLQPIADQSLDAVVADLRADPAFAALHNKAAEDALQELADLSQELGLYDKAGLMPETVDRSCRDAYDRRYHKVKATVSFDEFAAIWSLAQLDQAPSLAEKLAAIPDDEILAGVDIEAMRSRRNRIISAAKASAENQPAASELKAVAYLVSHAMYPEQGEQLQRFPADDSSNYIQTELCLLSEAQAREAQLVQQRDTFMELAESNTKLAEIVGKHRDKLQTENARLSAELAEARKNSERYKWLRDEHIGDDPESINMTPGRERGLDAAIDAAIAASKEQGK